MLQLDLITQQMHLESDDEVHFDFHHFRLIEVQVFDVYHDFLALN